MGAEVNPEVLVPTRDAGTFAPGGAVDGRSEHNQPMMIEAWVTLGVLVVAFAALITHRLSPPVGIVGALLALYFAGVVDAAEAFGGFAEPAPITIAALYVVAAGVERTGALSHLVRRVLGGVGKSSGFVRLLGVAGGLSTVMANTPIVAMLINPVVTWSERRQAPASRYLIPLSYVSILGGMLTVIGTSTNLIGSGLVADAGLAEFSFFEPALIGGPVALVGFVVVAVAGPRLLPDRGERAGEDIAAPFTISMVVEPEGSVDGTSVAHADLRDLPGVYLVAVERHGEVTAPVSPEFVLAGGDALTFAGSVSEVVDLGTRPGLRPDEEKHLDALDGTQHSWFEAVIGATSPLVGHSLKEVGFRSRYQAAVVALHRSGVGLDRRLGDVQLQVGDSLLLVSDLDFAARWRGRGDFLLIEQRREAPPTNGNKVWLALAILACLAAGPLLGIVDVLTASLGAAVAMVVTGVLTPRQARDGVDSNVVIMIGAALGVGTAVRVTGLAAEMAELIVGPAQSLGPWWVAAGLIVITLVLTELVTNAAAVAIMIPIALDVAVAMDADPRRFALGTVVAASASFLTPIGYQTNTMVYGPGRYRFGDYLRLGVPLTLVVVALAPPLMIVG